MKKRKHKSKNNSNQKQCESIPKKKESISIAHHTSAITATMLIITFTIIYLTIGPHLTGYDEWRHMQLAENLKDGKGYTYFEVPYYKHPPLLPLTASTLPAINDTTIVLFTTTFAILSLIAMWFLSQNILKKNIYPILAIILLGLNPNFINQTSFFGMELMIVLGFILYFIFYTKYLATGKRIYALLTGITLGLGMLTKAHFILLVPTTIIQYIYTHRKDIKITSGKLQSKRNAIKHLKYTIIAFALAYIIFEPYSYYLSINNAPSTSSIFGDEFFGKTNWALFDGSGNNRTIPPLTTYLDYIINFHKYFSIPIAILFIFALWYHIKKEEEEKTIANYLLITFFTSFIFFTIYGTKCDRFIVQLAPFAILFSLLYMPKLIKHFKLNEKQVISIVIILLLIQTAPIVHARYKSSQTFEDCEALDYLRTHTTKDSMIVVHNYHYARFKAYMDGFYEWSGPPPLDQYAPMNSILYRPDYYIVFDNKKDKLDEPLFHLETREACIGNAEEAVKDKEKDIYKNPHILIYKVNHTALDNAMKTAIGDAKIIEIKFQDADSNPLNGVRIQTDPSVIPRQYRSRPDGTKIILMPGATHNYYIFKIGYEQKHGTITTENERYCIDQKCYAYDEPVTITLKKTSLFHHGLSFGRW